MSNIWMTTFEFLYIDANSIVRLLIKESLVGFIEICLTPITVIGSSLPLKPGYLQENSGICGGRH
jgi:hypothetical protein